ncbi:MAG: DUF2442 domain-containing protein [Planctomycetaceae bacterium]|nr:DUF2442 domain-containing protein [Planctomycetaceae bacterium]
MAEHDIIKLEILPDYRLYLYFADGRQGIFEAKKHIPFGGLSESLNDPDYFAKVEIDPEWKTIYWPNGYDLCPDCLYHWSTGIPFPDYVQEYEQKQEKAKKRKRELVEV